MNENFATANVARLINREVAVRPQSKAKQKATDRQRALVVVAGFGLMAAIGALFALSAEYPMSSHTTDVISNNNLRTGKITSSSIDDENCREQEFDNQTGRMTRSEQSCDTNAFDSSGVMVPSGTIHRLDAISKSFSGR
jgi:hypothetical protein